MFAQIVGTLQLLRPVERPLIRGLLINRFRGRRELFDEGRRWLEANTGVPVVGVMPWLDELFPPKIRWICWNVADANAPLSWTSRAQAAITEQLLRLGPIGGGAHGSTALGLPWGIARHPRCGGDSRQQTDPAGSGPVCAELASMLSWSTSPCRGGVFGICGGMQMMGESLQDPDGLEGEPHTDTPSEHVPGLALLPIRTVFGGGKALDNATALLCGQRRCPRCSWRDSNFTGD